MDYNRDLQPTDYVYVVLYGGGLHTADKVRVKTAYTNFAQIVFWVLDKQIDLREAGSPVFDEYGSLIGILSAQDGQIVVLSLVRLREKSPTLYKQIK